MFYIMHLNIFIYFLTYLTGVWYSNTIGAEGVHGNVVVLQGADLQQRLVVEEENLDSSFL